MKLIPSIDLRGGRCVRLLQGDFARETRYELEPHELLARYRALGADWLHVVDLDGARDGQLANRSTILALATQSAVRLQVGGGLRALEVVDDLLRHGVDRAVVGSAAIEHAEAVRGWLARFGPERLCLAFDVRLDAQQVPRVQVRGWQRATQVSLWEALDGYAAGGLRHVLCTDVERDGALQGPNLALYRECVERHPGIAWQASGGVRDAADLAALEQLGCAAAISGKALLEERIPAAQLQRFLPGAGV